MIRPPANAGRRPPDRDRGFALLIVLWTLALLALLGTQLTASGRGEAQLARNLRSAATVEAAADGATFEAVFHLLDVTNRHWRADGASHRVTLPNATVDVRIESQAGKVNPNTAQPPLLAALLHAVGADSRSAESIAAAIVAWRFPDAQTDAASTRYRAAGRDYGPPGAPLENLDELGLVLGMTPELLARLKPHLSLFHDGDPDLALADPVVRQALREATGAEPPASGAPPDESVVAITATASGAHGTRFVRRAVVRIGQRGQGSLYEILEWGSGIG